MNEQPPIASHSQETAEVALKRVMSSLYPEVTISNAGHTNGICSGSATFSPQLEHTGAPGWVQGGLTAAVLDSVSARIANAALNSTIATGTLDLRYRQPVLIDGGPYLVKGISEEPRSRTVRVHAQILSSEGRPLVEASGMFVAVTRN